MSQVSPGGGPQGRAISQSTYVRMMPTSGEAAGMLCIRSISLRARSFTLSGIPAASIFSRKLEIARVRGAESGVGESLAGAVGRDEVLEHGEPFGEVRLDRQVDDPA